MMSCNREYALEQPLYMMLFFFLFVRFSFKCGFRDAVSCHLVSRYLMPWEGCVSWLWRFLGINMFIVSSVYILR